MTQTAEQQRFEYAKSRVFYLRKRIGQLGQCPDTAIEFRQSGNILKVFYAIYPELEKWNGSDYKV